MNMIKKIKVILVGAFPPPIGGNAIHIKRLLEQCLSKGIPTIVLDPYNFPTKNDLDEVYRFKGNAFIRSIKLFLKIIEYHGCLIIHIHVSAMQRFIFFAVPFIIFTIGKKRIITIHSGSFQKRIESKSKFYHFILFLILNSFDNIITVNDQQANYLIRLGLRRNKISVIPAFIPPLKNKSNLNIPINLKKLQWLILSSGNCTKLYGYIELLNVIGKLQEEGLDIGIILAIYPKYDKAYLKQIEEKVRKLNNAVIFRDLNPEKFIALQKLCSIYIRATYADGDSIAIREASMAGCQIVASDCTIRPKGCSLFKTGSQESLYIVLKRALFNSKYGILTNKNVDYWKKIESFYTT